MTVILAAASAVAFSAVLVGCCSCGGGDDDCDRPVRVAVYVDRGARNTGVYRWLELTSLSEGMDMTPVDAAMIRGGALSGMDVLVVPGGRSPLMAKTLGAEGRERIRGFVRDGGGYIGTCAGSALAMESSKSHPDMLHLIPYRSVGTRGHADMMIDFNDDATRLAGIPAKSHRIRYAEGPILVPSESVEGAQFAVIATYGSYVDTDSTKSRERMSGKIAAVAGTYGKGRVFVTTVHPEYDYDDHYVLEGAFRYVTGRDLKWRIPQRRPGQLAVGFVTVNSWGVETAEVMRSACRQLDLVPVNDKAVGARALNHLDVLIAPDGNDFRERGNAMLGKCRGELTAFLARGGKILTWGKAGEAYAKLGDGVLVVADGRAVLEHLGRMSVPTDVGGERTLSVPKREGRRIRAAVYTDQGGANYNVLETLALSPDFDATVVSAADVAGGALRDFDLLLQPGGGCHGQYTALGTNGVAEIERFVRGGGKYYGICAGAFLATQTCEAKKPRIGLIPYRDQCVGTYRGWGEVPMKMTEAGLEIFGNSVTNRSIIYWGGPVLVPGDPIPDTDVKILATYDCDVFCSCTDKPIPSWYGLGAFAAGRVGQGKVFISCPHPEKDALTYDMVLSGIEYLTGVRPEQVRRCRVQGAKSVLFRTSKERDIAAYFVNTLIRDRSLDVTSNSELPDLSHFDALILSTPKKEDLKNDRLIGFANQGGTVVALADSEKELAIVKDVPWLKVARSFDEIIPQL